MAHRQVNFYKAKNDVALSRSHKNQIAAIYKHGEAEWIAITKLSYEKMLFIFYILLSVASIDLHWKLGFWTKFIVAF